MVVSHILDRDHKMGVGELASHGENHGVTSVVPTNTTAL
jgi:hypothetical protein